MWKFLSENRNLIRSSIAFLLSTIFLLIPSTREWLLNLYGGDRRTLLFIPLAVLLVDTTGTIGKVSYHCILFTLVIVVTGCIDLLMVRYLVGSPWAAFAYFVVMILVMSMAKMFMRKNVVFDKVMSSAVNLMALDLAYGYLDQHLGRSYRPYTVTARMACYLTGAWISWLASVLVFPIWAGDIVRKQMKEGLRMLGELFAVMTDLLLAQRNENHETNTDKLKQMKQLVDDCRKTFAKITISMEESKMEISYSYFDRNYYDIFTIHVRRLLKHLTMLSKACERWVVQEQQLCHVEPGKHQRRLGYLKAFVLEVEPELLDLVDVVMGQLRTIYKLFQTWEWSEQDELKFESNQNLESADFLKVKIVEKKLHKLHSLFPRRDRKEPMKKSCSLTDLRILRSNSLMGNSRIIPKLDSLTPIFKRTKSKQIFQDVLSQFYHRQSSVLFNLFNEMNTENNSTDMEDILSVYFLILGLGTFAEQIEYLGAKANLIQKKKKLYIPFMSFKKKESKEEEEEEEEDNHSNTTSNNASIMTHLSVSSELPPLRPLSAPTNCFSAISVRERIAFCWSIFSSPQCRCALRVSILSLAIFVLALIPSTIEFFHQWRLTWAIVSIVIVSSPQAGDMFVSGFYRLGGTVVGGLVAAGVAIASHKQHTAVMMLGVFLFVLPCMYFRTLPKTSRLGAISLVSFTAVLFGEILDKNDGADVFGMAVRRTVSIMLGVVLSFIGSLLIFPLFSRKSVRVQMTRVLHQEGLLFSKIMYSVLTDRMFLKPSLSSFLKTEFDIQTTLIQIESLIGAAKSEASIHPFDHKSFSEIAISLQDIHDLLHSMRLVLFRGFTSDFRSNVLMHLHSERKNLVASTLMTIYISNNCLLSEFPLPPAVPNLSQSFAAYQSKLAELSPCAKSRVAADSNHLCLCFLMAEMVKSLENVATLIKRLYGTQEHLFTSFDEALERASCFEKIERRLNSSSVPMVTEQDIATLTI